MAADLSRVRLDPLLDHAGVELKQGAVLLDADANELMAIVDRRLRALASDTLGRATVSSTTPAAFAITPAAAAFDIGIGRLYVDGLLAENHGAPSTAAAQRMFDDLLAEPRFANPVAYAAQPYLPQPPALPTAGRHLVYLDVWNREVTYLENPALVESAVGVETSSRVQTVWQVRVLAEAAGSAVTCSSPDGDIAGWAALIAPSTGRLSTGTFDVTASPDPCELPPTGGYRGLENQLYRVEIHDGGLPGAGATFKWSRENASVGSRVASIVSAGELELDTLGRDDVLRFNSGDWVEIVDDVREFSQAPGEMRKITVTEATRRISFTPPLPAAMLPASFPDSTLPAARHLRVKRWDQQHGVFRTGASGTTVQVQDLDAAGSTGVIDVPAATVTLLLEDGITVRFDAPAGSRGFKPGDWWVFAARTSDATVEVLDRAPPRGTHHHYARLAIWDAAAGTATDCRHRWPPEAGGGDCACTACVTPESHASGQLTIQAAVDRVRDGGGTVCLHPGQYSLAQPVRIAGATSLRIHGQGAATVLLAAGTAFSIESSAAIAIEDLVVLSVATQQQPAIAVNTVLGLALRQLVLAVIGNSDNVAAAIALTGVVAGALIADNLIVAPDGIRASTTKVATTTGAAAATSFLLTAALRIEGNVLSCQRSGVVFNGTVAHFYDTSLRGNQVLGCRSGGLATLGLAAPGAGMRFSDNLLSVNGSGIACAVDGAWIENNKVTGVKSGDRQPSGAGITLATGLDRNGSDQCQILGNQVIGFPLAGIFVQAPARSLIVKLNIVERCGTGIVMDDAASGGLVSIENNHLSDIGTPAPTGDLAGTIVGIGVARTEAATIAGNTLRQIGINAAAGTLAVAGIQALAVQRLRIAGNDIVGVGPPGDFGSPMAGIMVRAPYAVAEVRHNHVERDLVASQAQTSSFWWALLIDEAVVGGQLVSRLARFTALRVDDQRTLVLNGNRAFVDVAVAAVDATGAAAATGTSAIVLGNVLVARGVAPVVQLQATADVMFSDNRCELRGSTQRNFAVLLAAPVAVINANRVRGGAASIRVPDAKAQVTAIGNITTNGIVATLRPEMLPLNLIA